MDDLRLVTQQIRDRSDLRTYIVDLKKVGSAHMTLCPFHPDVQPSMQVNKEYYYCYSCHATGDFIDWIRHEHDVDFTAALALAAGHTGVKIDEEGIGKKIKKHERERSEREEQQRHYRRELETNPEVMAYLRNDRGLSEETIAHFGLGHRPDYDAVSIPIYSRSGKLETFAYRYLNGGTRYRVFNTETWIKGQNLYNPQCLEFGSGAVHICEGYFDVMSVWQAGFKRVVGLMEGLLNDNHVRELGANPLVFIPDRKTENDFDLFKRSVFRLRQAHPDLLVKVALLPEGDANSQGPEAIQKAVAEAESPEFAILKHDLDRANDVEEQYRIARGIGREIRDPLLKDDVVVYLSHRWGKSRDVVKQALQRSDAAELKVSTIREGIVALEETEMRAATEGLHMGWPLLRRYIDRPHTQQLLYFVGRTKVGKTMWAVNYLHRCKADEVPTLFLSLEQPLSEITYRLSVMMLSEMDRAEQYELHEAIVKNTDRWSAVKAGLELSYMPHLRMYDRKFTPTVMKDVIVDASYSLGRQVRVVVLDYVGLIRSETASPKSYERMSDIALSLQEVTREMDVLGIYLGQLSREGGSGTTEVTYDMIRDTGVIEETADYIVGCWRDKDDKEVSLHGLHRMHTSILANRHGKKGEGFLWFDERTLLITEPAYGQDNT